LANYKNVNPVDWQDEVAGRTGITQTHSINAAGGNKKLPTILAILLMVTKPSC